jgi:hypothetical protein
LLAGGLLVVAVGGDPTLEPRVRLDAAPSAAVAGSVLVALVAVPLAVLRLGLLRDRDVAAGEALAPGLSGALASLDLALLYDVLLAHRWRRRASVRPVRHRAVGQAALVATDLTRLRRSPQLLVLPALAVVLPYAVAAAGAGRVVLLVAAFAGFVTGLPLLAGLRVLTRTPALLRVLPFGVAESRRLALRVPALVLLLFGLACAPAVDRSVDADGVTATSLGVAVGTAALAAAVRWVTGRPPDYTRPLVSTPAGGVPTNLYGSVVRGFDVLLLATAPLLLSPTSSGAAWSVAVSIGVLAYLTGRR